MANPRSPASVTLAEILAALALLPGAGVGTPSSTATLESYVATYGGGISRDALALRLGYDPLLFERVDQRVQALPRAAIDRIAGFLQRPAAEVIWAAGGRLVAARAPGLGRRVR